MRQTIPLTFIVILLLFRATATQAAQRKPPTKSAATKPLQKGAEKSKPPAPASSTSWCFCNQLLVVSLYLPLEKGVTPELEQSRTAKARFIPNTLELKVLS